MDEVAENSDELMERYLEGEEISHDEIVGALKEGVTAGTIFPVTCGIATKNLGTDRLLDALVSDLPSPAKKGAVDGAATPRATTCQIEPDDDGDPIAYVFKTLADPFAGRINLFRVYSGTREGRLAADEHARPLEGADRPAARRRAARRWRTADEFGAGRHRRGREAQGDPFRRRAVVARTRGSRSRSRRCRQP